MVKRFLLSAAVVGALATSAMAYNVSELSAMEMTSKFAIPVNASVTDTNLTMIGFNQTQLSNALIFPAYNAGNGWETTVRVINPDPNHAVVAKVVLYDAKDSHEVRDFNIYLSANDVWVGKIKVDSDGVVKIISTDDSTPLENGGVATPENPFEKAIDSKAGYIEVIAMAVTDGKSGAHKDHEGLREAYNKFSKIQRTGQFNPDIIWKDGVIQNDLATTPYIELNATNNVTVTGVNDDIKWPAYLVESDSKDGYDSTKEYAFTAPCPGTTFLGLTGDIRITNPTLGEDMDIMAYKVNYNANVTGNPTALVYIEGEKANLADVYLGNNGNNDPMYVGRYIEDAINDISLRKYYITYGDAEVNKMYALLTNPFKRVYVQAKLDDADTPGVDNEDGVITHNSKVKITDNSNSVKYYKDAYIDEDGNINYGSVSLVNQVIDESENIMSAGQFSPAVTPTITLYKELDWTGVDINDNNTLAYYLNQAQEKGYKRGYVKVSNVDNNPIPGIMTQMLATKAGGVTVTNWIIPQGN